MQIYTLLYRQSNTVQIQYCLTWYLLMYSIEEINIIMNYLCSVCSPEQEILMNAYGLTLDNSLN